MHVDAVDALACVQSRDRSKAVNFLKSQLEISLAVDNKYTNLVSLATGD